MKTLIQQIAETINAIKTCRKTGNVKWEKKHIEALKEIEKTLPHGAGFDSGTTILVEMSLNGKILFSTEFHHMQETGFYDGWTDHTIIVSPNFNDIDIVVTGSNKNSIREYIGEVFHDTLTAAINP